MISSFIPLILRAQVIFLGLFYRNLFLKQSHSLSFSVEHLKIQFWFLILKSPLHTCICNLKPHPKTFLPHDTAVDVEHLNMSKQMARQKKISNYSNNRISVENIICKIIMILLMFQYISCFSLTSLTLVISKIYGYKNCHQRQNILVPVI